MRLRMLIAPLAAAGLALLAGNPAKAAGELFFYNWTNYFPPELLTKFEKDTGIKVTMDGYDSNETLLAKLQAGGGNYDVIVPSDYMVKIMIADGLLQPIDAPSMTNFAKVSKRPADRRLCLSQGRRQFLEGQFRGAEERAPCGERQDLHQLDHGAGEHRPGEQLHRLQQRHRGLRQVHGQGALGRPGGRHAGGRRR